MNDTLSFDEIALGSLFDTGIQHDGSGTFHYTHLSRIHLLLVGDDTAP